MNFRRLEDQKNFFRLLQPGWKVLGTHTARSDARNFIVTINARLSGVTLPRSSRNLDLQFKANRNFRADPKDEVVLMTEIGADEIADEIAPKSSELNNLPIITPLKFKSDLMVDHCYQLLLTICYSQKAKFRMHSRRISLVQLSVGRKSVFFSKQLGKGWFIGLVVCMAAWMVKWLMTVT